MHQRMDALIGVPEVGTRWIQTGIALRRILLFPAPFTLDLTPGRHVPIDPGGRQVQSLTAMRTILG